MSLLLLESFERLGTSGSSPQVDSKFTVTGSNWRLDTGAVSPLAIKITSSGVGQNLIVPVPSPVTFYIGFFFKTESLGSGSGIIAGYDSTTRSLGIGSDVAGRLTILRNTNILASTDADTIKKNIWHYIEFRGTISNTVGVFTLKVDGVQLLNATGQNTRGGTNNFIDSFRFLPGGGNTQSLFWYDDFYVSDSGFYGKSQIAALAPTADSGSQQWTTSTGTDHYALVDENPSNSDTDYNVSGTSGQADLFDVTDNSLTTIHGVQICAIVRETDGTPFNVNLTCKSGSTTSAGSNIAVGGQTYSTKMRIIESDPDTATAWTDSGLDAAKFGIAIP